MKAKDFYAERERQQLAARNAELEGEKVRALAEKYFFRDELNSQE